MSSNAHRIETLQAEYLDPRLYDEGPAAGPLRVSRGALLAPLSRAFDLAERRRSGHAQRVAFIATYLAAELELETHMVEAVFFAGILHDIGMAGATTPAFEGQAAAHHPNDQAQMIEALNHHCELGARLVRRLGLGDDVARAVANHHDCWDGSGLPGAISGDRLPLTARIIAVADRVESLVDHDGSPLRIRRAGPEAIARMAGVELDPEITARMVDVACRDEFWLGFYDEGLQHSLVSLNYGGLLEGETLMEMLGVISDLVDGRNGRRQGHGRRVAEMAASLAAQQGLDDRRIQLVEVAALLQDIGTLGIPVSLLHKPDILTVDEMTTMQLHPTLARDILSEVPGFGPAAWWIACHHERVDGKGYPGMLEGAQVPLEAQIIGICETFEALTNDRPYRVAMDPDAAMEVIRGLAGLRFDPVVVALFEDAFVEAAA